MKKIFFSLALGLILSWSILEFIPDPIFSPHLQSAASFSYSLDSSGEAGHGLKLKSTEYGEISLSPFSANRWLVIIKNSQADLEINGSNKASLLLSMKADWESPFIVTLDEISKLVIRINTSTNQLSLEQNQILANRRKNLVRLIFLPQYGQQVLKGECYYGTCHYKFNEGKDHSLKLNINSLEDSIMSSNYIVEADEKGAERIELFEKNIIKEFLSISISTKGRAERIPHNDVNLSTYSIESFRENTSIAISTTGPDELKKNAKVETKSINVRTFITDVKNNKLSIEELGDYHQTLRKILLSRDDSVEILLNELKRTKTSEPFYISSVAALTSVDTEKTQEGLRQLVNYHLERNGNFEARNLIMGVAQSSNPSEETIDFLIDKAYDNLLRKDVNEVAQLALGSVARATKDPAISARLIERPLRDLEDYVQGRVPSIQISNVLEIIGNSGEASAFKSLKILIKTNKDPAIQVSLLNALRYMPQEEATKLLNDKISSADQLISQQAKQALELRCEHYPQHCK